MFRLLLIASVLSFASGACLTTSGETCVFPFKYQDKTYTTCTDAGSSTYWCATSLSDDGTYNNYGDCADTGCVKTPSSASTDTCSDGSMSGAETGVDCGGSCGACSALTACKTVDDTPCVFPFVYSGKKYSSGCADGYWCATAVSSDLTYTTYGNCKKGCPVDAGTTYSGSGSTTTCSDTKKNGDETGIDCGGSCPACGAPSACVTTTGGKCVFPFVYSGKKYSTGCAEDYWCATTVAADLTYSTYGDCAKGCPVDAGTPYSGSGSGSGSTTTCSDTTKNGDETGIDCGGSCPACGAPSACVTTTGAKCKFPFVYAGKKYSTGCAENYWCATTVAADLTYSDWGNCAKGCPVDAGAITTGTGSGTGTGIPAGTNKCSNVHCESHGVCENGLCMCNSGYTGASCGIAPGVTTLLSQSNYTGTYFPALLSKTMGSLNETQKNGVLANITSTQVVTSANNARAYILKTSGLPTGAIIRNDSGATTVTMSDLGPNVQKAVVTIVPATTAGLTSVSLSLTLPSKTVTDVISIDRYNATGGVVSSANVTFTVNAGSTGTLKIFRYSSGSSTGVDITTEGGSVTKCSTCSRGDWVITSTKTSTFVGVEAGTPDTCLLTSCPAISKCSEIVTVVNCYKSLNCLTSDATSLCYYAANQYGCTSEQASYCSGQSSGAIVKTVPVVLGLAMLMLVALF